MWIAKYQFVLSSEILSITMGEDSLYIKIANMINLQSQTSIVAWELSQMTQVKKQPTHTTPPAAIQPPSLCQWTDTLCMPSTYCLRPFQQYEVMELLQVGAEGEVGIIDFMLQASSHHSQSIYSITFNREANVSWYTRTPNRLEKINITVIVAINHNDSKDITIQIGRTL